METFSTIINNEPLVLVDFFATWCRPCMKMHPVLEQLKEQMGGKLRILKVDVDNNMTISRKYVIQSVPTLILFKQGQQVWRQSGALSMAALVQVVNQFV